MTYLNQNPYLRGDGGALDFHFFPKGVTQSPPQPAQGAGGSKFSHVDTNVVTFSYKLKDDDASHIMPSSKTCRYACLLRLTTPNLHNMVYMTEI